MRAETLEEIVLETLQHQGGWMTFGQIHKQFPRVRQATLVRILKQLTHSQKAIFNINEKSWKAIMEY